MPDPDINSFLRIFDHIGKVKIKSITDTLFKYGTTILVVASLTAVFNKPPTWSIILLYGLGSLFLIFGLVFYAIFAFKNPDYLRSETYQIQKQSLELMGDSSNQGKIDLSEKPIVNSPFDQKENDDETKLLE